MVWVTWKPLQKLYSDFRSKYGKSFEKKKKVIKPKCLYPKLTEHAKIRFDQRFDSMWYDMEDILFDLKKWWRSIRTWAKEWTFSVLWNLGRYIISKDMTIITMTKL